MFMYIFGTAIFLIIVVVYREYKSEKKYEEERYHTPTVKKDLKKEAEEKHKALEEEIERKREAAHKEIARREEASKAEEAKKQKLEAQKREQREKEREEARKEAEALLKLEKEKKREETPQQEEKPEPIQKVEEIIKKDLPACNYPQFTHVRLIEMGLSDEEAVEFVTELVPQLEEQIDPIKKAIASADFHQVERLTHGVKGSATNIGTGGIADLLVEWNTYLKSETDVDVVNHYLTKYIEYSEKLKVQYS